MQEVYPSKVARMRYGDIVGQEDLIHRLRAFVEFYTSKGSTPGHILLSGGEGMGQHTIATAFSNELDRGFLRADAAKLEIQGDLTALVTNLREGQILMLSNIHSLRRPLAEELPSVLRDYALDITIGTRTHVIPIKPFTLIGTCPRKSDCPPQLLSEFSIIVNMQPYSRAELQGIAQAIAEKMEASLEPTAAELIAAYCDGRPADLEVTLRRLARAINKPVLTESDVTQAFTAFGINVQREADTSILRDLKMLSGIDFERSIASLLARMGFHTEMTKVSGDGGIDIIALLDKPIVGGRYLFQCKRFGPENLVGAPALRDFYGAVTADRAVKGVFITTSDFTLQAQEFGQRAGLELINLTQLEKLLLDHGLIESLE